MHEIGITRSLVEIAEKHVRAAGQSKVLSVSVEIGELSGVVAEAVEFCFDAVVRGTMLEGSRLIIHRVPGAMRCLDCQKEFPADNFTFECPLCSSFLLEFTRGKELRMTEMEVE